jgi:hypothetical protein
MNTDRRVNTFVSFRNFDGLSKIIRMRIAGSDVQHDPDAGVPGSANNFIAVGVKLIAVNMAVRINQHDF